MRRKKNECCHTIWRCANIFIFFLFLQLFLICVKHLLVVKSNCCFLQALHSFCMAFLCICNVICRCAEKFMWQSNLDILMKNKNTWEIYNIFHFNVKMSDRKQRKWNKSFSLKARRIIERLYLQFSDVLKDNLWEFNRKTILLLNCTFDIRLL